MERFTDTPYTQLSGGEIQLVMLARALGQRTRIIIMDEPTCHLDFANELIFLETIVRLCKTTDLTILMATHSPNHAFYFETHDLPVTATLMHNKTLRKSGLPGEVLTQEDLEEVYGIKARIITYVDDDGREQRNISLLKTVGKM
jgi:iron complex transport system ATP-binding protein